ncbi:hypothetical protein BpHYR1_031319 [Brachionus plicatilis]|uniref:Uncharacterized protein n=1 Tax=Brachionus plicatilis TaxID=10195 RepID=A0A3M7QRE1_BRAPC|nr:hypothetical protein BpHYR1_031319 [Brachionus plicatilis]
MKSLSHMDKLNLSLKRIGKKFKLKEILKQSSEKPREKDGLNPNQKSVSKLESSQKSTLIIKEKTKNLTPSSIILNRIDSEMEKISLQNSADNVRIYDSPAQVYPLYTQDMDSLKEYLNTDVLYYDYETSNLMKLNESKSGSTKNLFVQNNQRQVNNGPNPNQVSYCSPNALGTWMPKNSRYEDFTDELLNNQKNLYQIADFQNQVIRSAMDEICQPRGKLSSIEKNESNIPRPKMSNVQSLIVPNQENAIFEGEKFKRNI